MQHFLRDTSEQQTHVADFQRDEDMITAIKAELIGIGMNVTKTNFPQKSDIDYHENPKDLEDFFGIFLENDPQEEDVNRLFRLGSLKAHPDKRGNCSPKVRAWCTSLQAIMSNARDQLLQRICWHKQAKKEFWQRQQHVEASRQSRRRYAHECEPPPSKVLTGLSKWLAESADLWSDRETVLYRVRQDGAALKYAAEALKEDREVVLASVKKNPHALEHASEKLRDDQDVVLAALVRDPMALEFASPTFQADRNIVLDAMKRNTFVLKHAAPKLLADADLILTALQKHEFAIQFAAESLRCDLGFILKALQLTSHILELIPQRWCADRQVILTAVKKNGFALKHATPELQADPEIIAAALKQDSRALVYASGSPSCAANHLLHPFIPKDARYICDACDRRIEAHSCTWGCRSCGYDVCLACRIQSWTKQTKQRTMQNTAPDITQERKRGAPQRAKLYSNRDKRAI